MHITVYGGTFDPPTLAHEAIIGAALERPDVDELWVMPSGDREDKPEMSSSQHRLAMLGHIATQVFHDDRLRVSDFEIRLPQPNTTIDTYGALLACFPTNDFRFIFGADSYAAMLAWKGGAWLRRHMGLLLVERAGYELPPESTRICHLRPTGSFPDVSSTEVRRRLRSGEPLTGLVNPLLAARLTQHQPI